MVTATSSDMFRRAAASSSAYEFGPAPKIALVCPRACAAAIFPPASAFPVPRAQGFHFSAPAPALALPLSLVILRRSSRRRYQGSQSRRRIEQQPQHSQEPSHRWEVAMDPAMAASFDRFLQDPNLAASLSQSSSQPSPFPVHLVFLFPPTAFPPFCMQPSAPPAPPSSAPSTAGGAAPSSSRSVRQHRVTVSPEVAADPKAKRY